MVNHRLESPFSPASLPSGSRAGWTTGVTAHQPNGVALKMDEAKPAEPYRAEALMKRRVRLKIPALTMGKRVGRIPRSG